MDKTAIRNFAIWARNKLMSDVAYRAGLMGITADGIADKLPQSTNSVHFFDIGASMPYQITGREIAQRSNLVSLIKKKAQNSDYTTAYSSVIEEVAYTWFNRLIAIRFMEVNDYLPAHVRVLSSESGKLEPDIVSNPFDTGLLYKDRERQEIIQLKNDNKLDEVFRILFIKQCNALAEILPFLFEGISDYTELLLNVSYIDQNGVLYHLVHDIPEDDFNVEKSGQVEIIGWLYQYYIAEPKDRLINAHKQYKDVEIPYVTQIFTSDWIVRFMVENSLGRLWIENNPNDDVKKRWKFFVETDDISNSENNRTNPEEICVFDPCVGSGHILVYAFDVLMDIYESAGYSKRDASELIIRKNLYGLDINKRAAQLSYFSLMMKARQYNRRILNKDIVCNVFSFEDCRNVDINLLQVLGEEKRIAIKILEALKKPAVLGSLLSINVGINEIHCLENKIKEITTVDVSDIYGIAERDNIERLVQIINIVKLLVQEYDIVVTNPPYMNASLMPDSLKEYIQVYYGECKTDTFAAFIKKSIDYCKKNGHIGMLTPYVWLYLSTHEQLRHIINQNTSITSLVQLEYNAFESACVPVVSFTLKKTHLDISGEYISLSDFRGTETQAPKTLEAINNSKCGYRYSVSKKNFECIPGEPIAFSLSSNLANRFITEHKISDYCSQKMRICTGDNNRFLRLWFEVNETELLYPRRWVAFSKGGEYRKWYGNWDYVLDYKDNGVELKAYKGFSGGSDEYYFKPGLVWTDLSSSKISFRDFPSGAIACSAGPMIYFENDCIRKFIEGYLNSKVAEQYVKVLCGTIHFQWGDIAKIPVIYDEQKETRIIELVDDNNRCSKRDWDSFETSWDFKKHPLI